MKEWLTASTRWPRLTLTIAFLMTALSVFVITRIKPESSLDAMLDPHDPATRAMTRVMQQFPVAEEMLILISTPDDRPIDQSQLINTAERLAIDLRAQSDMVAAVRYKPTQQTIQFVEKVLVPAGLLYLNDSELAEMRSRLTVESMNQQFKRNQSMLAAPGPAAGGIAKAILQDPLRLHELLAERLHQLPDASQGEAFLSPSGRDLLIRVEGMHPPSDLDFSAAFTNRVKDIISRIDQSNLTFRITGAYAITAHNAAMIRSDAIQDSVATSISLALIFILFYRHPVWVFIAAFTPIAIGITCGFGIYGLFHPTITPLAAVIGGAMGGIGIDYSTHMLAHYRKGKPPAELLQRLFVPLLAACVTSVIGFAVIGWSPIRLLRDFAVVGSLSLIGAFIAAITILPAMLTLRPTDPSARFNIKPGLWRRPVIPLSISILAIAAISIVGSGVNLQQQDPNLANLHPQPNPPLDAQNEVSRRMGLNSGALMIHVAAGDPLLLLQKCADIQRKLYCPEVLALGVKSIIGPASLLPDPKIASMRLETFSADEMAAVLSNFDRSLASSDFSPEVYRSYRTFLSSLMKPGQAPDLSDLRQYPELADLVLPRGRDHHEALIHLNFNRPLERRQEVDDAITVINSRLVSIPESTLTGLSVINQQTLISVQRDLPRVALLAGSCVFAYLIFHYRSFQLAFLAVLPTLVSLVFLLAMMRVADISLNMVNLVMVPLLLGINIDFGIFATDTLRKPEEENLEDQYRSSLRAMLTCSATAVIGFGSLIVTSIPAVRSLGWLVNVGVIGCCMGTAFVLWPIVIIIARRHNLR